MCAMVEYNGCSFASSAVSTNFSISVKTLSNLLTVAFQEFLSTGENVSLLSPLKAAGFSPLNFASTCSSQKIRCVASCAIEWFSLLSFQFACSGVNPSIATLGGTNQSSLSCVVRSCSSKIDFNVGACSFCAFAADAANKVSRIKKYFILKF